MAAKHYLDPHNAAFAAAIANEPLPSILGYVEGHNALEALQKNDPAPDIDTRNDPSSFPRCVNQCRDIQVQGFDKGMSDIVLHAWRRMDIRRPNCLSPKSFGPLMEELARETGAAVVFPDYSLAPTKQYPFQIEQVYAVLDYIVREGQKHNLLTDRVVLAGDSVGGHFVIAMMQLYLERNLPSNIAHLIIYNPVTDTHKKLPSYEIYKDGPFLAEATMDWMIDACLPNKKDRETALASPLTFAPDSVLAKFAPTTMFLSDVDPLLDEARAFGHRLQEAGVDCAIIKAEGQMHAYASILALRGNATARAVNELAALRIRKALSGLS